MVRRPVSSSPHHPSSTPPTDMRTTQLPCFGTQWSKPDLSEVSAIREAGQHFATGETLAEGVAVRPHTPKEIV